MDYGALETELTGILNTYFGAHAVGDDPGVLLNTVYQARVMPSSPSEVLQEYTKGLVNVQYIDSQYGDPKSTNMILQDETVYVACYVQCDKARGVDGAYRLVDLIKKALIGYRPAGSTGRMWIHTYGDWRIEDGQLQPFLEFAFKTQTMQVRDEGPTETIDSIDSITTGGPLLVLDSDIYIKPDTETVVKEDHEVL